MKFLFVVQGEGRGHLTQAIALREMLVKNGHQVVGVLVGESNHRELPDFFSKNIQSNVLRFDSPNFLPLSRFKKHNLLISIIYNIFKVASYTRSIFFIRKQIKKLDADVVINFYELLVGLTYTLIPPKVPYICIAHQYLLLHPEFEFPQDRRTKSLMLRFFTRVTCVRAQKLLALSIHDMKDCPEERIFVIPPLLRKDVLNAQPKDGDYLHGYMLNDTYSDEIIRFHKEHPEVRMHFFWDRKDADETTEMDVNLTFHKLNDTLFVQYMQGCKAYATTAGFESVCEAMYLGKPVLMVPTHIEQECNAHDAAASGAGVVSTEFDFEKLLNFLPKYKPKPEFRTWVGQSETYILRELTNLSKE